MKVFVTVLLFLINMLLATEDPLQYVNSFIGTGGRGFGCGALNPGPQRPFGTMRIGPDTINALNVFVPWEHFGGYHYNDTYIRCFSHTHLVGAGIVDYGNIGVMPISTKLTSNLLHDYNFKSKFTHDKESAKPHFYNVNLNTWDIDVELTSTQFVGLHRHTFKKTNSPKTVLFYVSHALTEKNGCKDSEVIITNNEIFGFMLNHGSFTSRVDGVKIYYYAKFKRDYKSFGVWENDKILPNQRRMKGTNIGAYFEFEEDNAEFHVSISFQSIEQAKKNYEREVGSKSFDEIKKESENIWKKELSAIVVETKNIDDKVKFYSALYHSLTSPTQFSEGGNYLGFDRKIHPIDKGSDAYYTEFSIWDTFRTQAPLLSLLKPTVQRDIVRSMLNMYDQGGYLPRWPIAHGYTNGMIGQHANIIIADAFFKGIKDFNITKAYEGMRKGSTQEQRHAGRSGLESYNTKGYIPTQINNRGTSLTVEYAYDDWAISNIARVLGKKEDEQLFKKKSMNYKNHYSPRFKYFCPRNQDGSFDCPTMTENVFDWRYIEGDAWHWRFFAPHDSQGLINLFGKEYFIKELDRMFTLAKNYINYNILPNPYYWAGNEHDLGYVWYFNDADRPDLAQKHSRWILDNKYTIYSSGLDGNDDYGTLSSWFVFSSMGFFPLPGSSQYYLGSPLFDQVTLKHIKGTLKIVAYNNSNENIFVEKIHLNGVPISKYVSHDQLTNGNVVLEFWMKK
eukprot:gene6430-10438_t